MVDNYAITKERYDEIMDSLAQKRILVIGDIGIDRYTIGESSRLSQEAPVPIVSVDRSEDKLGLAANVLDNIMAFGGKIDLASLIGCDRYGEELIGFLKERNIETKLIFARDNRRTVLKERVFANGQQVVRVDHESTGRLSKEDEEFFWNKISGELEKFDGIIVEDYDKRLFTQNLANLIIAKAKELGKFIAVDPPSTSHVRHIDFYRGATVLTPNLKEAERLSGVEILDQKGLEEAGKKLLEAFECETLIITQGKKGMTLFPKGDAITHIPTFAREVFDVSGAGDTVVAMLSAAQLGGASLREAAILANYAAGAEVGKEGTATVSRNELWDYMESVTL